MQLRPTHTLLLVSLITGLFVSSVLAQHHRESAAHRCVGCATGNCQAGTHGYFRPTWRRWPGATTYPGFRKPLPKVNVPTSEVPQAADETRIEPRSRAGGAPTASAGTEDAFPAFAPRVPAGTTPEVAAPPVTFPDSGPAPEAGAPQVGLPGVDASPFGGGGGTDPAPAPPGNLFEGMEATPAESTPQDDNLFEEDFGQRGRTPEQKITLRQLQSRRHDANTPHHMLVDATLEANQLTELVTPTLAVSLPTDLSPTPDWAAAAATEAEEPAAKPAVLVEASTDPIPELAPPGNVKQVTFLQEQQAKAAPPTEEASGNPLRRRGVSSLVVPGTATREMEGKPAAATSQDAPKRTKRLRTTRRQNPLRAL